MGNVFKFPPARPGFVERWVKVNDEAEEDKYAEIIKRFGADDQVEEDDYVEAEHLWAQAWRAVELQKAIESIARTDGWFRVFYQIPFSTWRAFRSKD